MWGVALIALGLLCALGVYGDLAGPLGRGLADGTGALFGILRLIIPVLLMVSGAMLLRDPDRRGPDRRGPDRRGAGDPDAVTAAVNHRGARLTVAMVIALIAASGLLQIGRGRPEWDATLVELTDAGGLLGVAVGRPLESALAVGGAVLVLVALLVIAAVIATGTPLHRAARRTADGVRPVHGALRRSMDSLFELGPSATETTIDGNDSTAASAAGADGGLAAEAEVPLFDGGTAGFGDWDDEAEPMLSELVDDELPTEPVTEFERSVGLVVEESPVLFDAEAEGGLGATAPVGGEPSNAVGKDTGGEDPVPGSAPTGNRPVQLTMPFTEPKVNWKLPPLRMLERSKAHAVDRARVRERGRVLEAALAEHGVQTRLAGMVVGPSVTRYELELAPGVKVAKVTSLHKDIAYAMASPDVRILAPIPGKQAIGVEVPNDDRQLVAVGDILASPEAKAAHNPLEVAIGRDINGKAVMADLAKMPHILIAGATGAGKSSCINSLLTSILMRSTPDEVRLILIDPKRVELGQYNRLPHLLTQVVTNPKKAANALSWAVKEMERRYDLLSEVGFRDIDGYNAAFDRGEVLDDPGLGLEYHRLPYILIVVDELNDLMMVAARDVEESICRIAQMARAVGIHLVIATQRPSVNVITGVIKANIPARLAFAVSSLADSRVILDQGGAEKLLGRGDMLLLGPSSSIAQRVQGSWVTEEEVRAVVGMWRNQSPQVTYDDSVQGSDDTSTGSGGAGGGGDDDDDDLLRQAMELVVRSQLGSTSMLQRKLRVGFARAGRLMDLLEQRGVVGPSEGSKARAVLMTPEEFDALAE